MSASLSVVIPAYNEAARLGKTLRAVVDYLSQNAPDGEVIVVDDGSSDQTAALAREVERLRAEIVMAAPAELNHRGNFHPRALARSLRLWVAEAAIRDCAEALL